MNIDVGSGSESEMSGNQVGPCRTKGFGEMVCCGDGSGGNGVKGGEVVAKEKVHQPLWLQDLLSRKVGSGREYCGEILPDPG